MEYDETVYACAINRIFNYNCRDARLITERLASPSALFSLPERELRELLRGNSRYIDAVLSRDCLRDAQEEVLWAREKDVRIIYIRDREYPRRLRECPDAPTVLFYKGCADLNPSRAVAIVGTRKATGYGITQCRRIIEHLAALKDKPLIISGLAYGIDITAHLAAMDCGLMTAAVLPTGMDSIYPTPHRQHAVRITRHGGLVTDFPKGATPMAVTFLRRNRIIAGMADAVLLIESAEKGGGLITAGMALSSMVRIAFSQAVLLHRAVAVHASAVCCDGMAYLFTGKSGTGKSTHSRLWLRHVAGTYLLNDDNPVLKLRDDGVVMAYGSPWSGKTPCYRNEGCPVSGLARLFQSEGNRFVPKTDVEAFAVLLQGCSVIRKDSLLYGSLCDTLAGMSSEINVGILECRPDKDAVTVCRNGLERRQWPAVESDC